MEELYSIIFNLIQQQSGEEKAINPEEAHKSGVTDLKQEESKLNDPVINAMDSKPPFVEWVSLYINFYSRFSAPKSFSAIHDFFSQKKLVIPVMIMSI